VRYSGREAGRARSARRSAPIVTSSSARTTGATSQKATAVRRGARRTTCARSGVTDPAASSSPRSSAAAGGEVDRRGAHRRACGRPACVGGRQRHRHAQPDARRVAQVAQLAVAQRGEGHAPRGVEDRAAVQGDRGATVLEAQVHRGLRLEGRPGAPVADRQHERRVVGDGDDPAAQLDVALGQGDRPSGDEAAHAREVGRTTCRLRDRQAPNFGSGRGW
jgi:hypothetical protein